MKYIMTIKPQDGRYFDIMVLTGAYIAARADLATKGINIGPLDAQEHGLSFPFDGNPELAKSKFSVWGKASYREATPED
jgi:hypothetical protein